MEQIDVGKLLVGINCSENLMYILSKKQESTEQLISRIIYNYINNDLYAINEYVLTKYGYSNCHYNFFGLNDTKIVYSKKVIYEIKTEDKLEDILADFYSNKARIIKECDEMVEKVVYFSNKYNTFINDLVTVMNNDKSLDLNKQFKITEDIPYDVVDMKTFKVIKSSFLNNNIYNNICKKNVINYGYVKINIPYTVIKYASSASSYWKLKSFRQGVLEDIANNLLVLINIYHTRTSLTEQKFIINNYCDRSKMKKTFDNYKFTCAATKKFIKNNENAFNNKSMKIPEFK